MVHLRVAEQMLEVFPRLERQEFIVGNIAPDSGVPNEDWSVFTPDTNTSHFKTDGEIDIPKFLNKYMYAALITGNRVKIGKKFQIYPLTK